MKRLRRWSRGAGWSAWLLLAALVLSQGQGPAIVEPGRWFGTAVAVTVLATLLAPGPMTMALPAAGMATLACGGLFSLLPEGPGLAPSVQLMLGSAFAAIVSGMLCLEGDPRRYRAAVAGLAGVIHGGLMHWLTVAPMASPFAIGPWILPSLVVVWVLVGAVPRARDAAED